MKQIRKIYSEKETTKVVNGIVVNTRVTEYDDFVEIDGIEYKTFEEELAEGYITTRDKIIRDENGNFGLIPGRMIKLVQQEDIASSS